MCKCFCFHEPLFLLDASINYINCTYLFVYVQTQGPQEATGRMDYRVVILCKNFFQRNLCTVYRHTPLHFVLIPPPFPDTFLKVLLRQRVYIPSFFLIIIASIYNLCILYHKLILFKK